MKTVTIFYDNIEVEFGKKIEDVILALDLDMEQFVFGLNGNGRFNIYQDGLILNETKSQLLALFIDSLSK